MSEETSGSDQPDSISLASEIVAAYVSNNKVNASDIPDLISETFDAISGLQENSAHFMRKRDPAVPINKSVTPDYVICLEDGKKLKMLKRYLRTHYGMSPDDYRRKWALPADYPMTAPNYSKHRSKVAKTTGLGKGPTKRKSVKKRATRTRRK